MANYQALNSVFHALADPTRRAVVQRLARGPATVSELAKPFDMKLPTFMKHLRVLEDGGLVKSHKKGRVRTCHFQPKKLATAESWLARYRLVWEARLDRLDQFLNTQTLEDEQ